MKLTREFDSSILPKTFYAQVHSLYKRDSFFEKYPLVFEAVQKKDIEMFVSGKLPQELPDTAKKSKIFDTLWKHYSSGIDNADFLTKKAMYLCKSPFFLITSLFSSFVEANKIFRSKVKWFEITVENTPPATNKDAFCYLYMTGTSAIESTFKFSFKPVSESENAVLETLYTPYIDGKTSGVYAKALNKNAPPEAITANTVYHSVTVYYVGAGLCCYISGTTPQGNVNRPDEIFFDLGEEINWAERILQALAPAHAPLLRAIKNLNVNWVENTLLGAQNPDIIISHWDADHVLIAVNNAQNQQFAGFWNTARFFVPDWISPSIITVQGAMQNAGNGQNFLVANYNNANQSIQYIHPPTGVLNNFEFWKIDRYDGQPQAGRRLRPHPHDHGVFARLALASGNSAFLAGDCTYDIISQQGGTPNTNDPLITNANNGYVYLVVSHHGGRYTHTSARLQGQRMQNYIPRPIPNSVNTTAVYSANGVAFGHPKPLYVNDYTSEGWAHHLATHIGAMNGIRSITII